MNQYVLLLRGINVGGNNSIPMKALRTCLEANGCSDVVTYIQSGNVVFASKSTKEDFLTKKIAAALKSGFQYTNPILVIPAERYQSIVASAPKKFGKDPDRYRYDTLFVIPPLTALAASTEISTRDGVDTMAIGDGAVFFARIKGQESKSYLSKIAQSSIYQQITIRNWNTTKKLLEMISTE